MRLVRVVFFDFSGTRMFFLACNVAFFRERSHGRDASYPAPPVQIRTQVWHHVNLYLTRWLMRKHQKYAGRLKRAVGVLERIARAKPSAFVHWKLGYIPKGWIMGAG